LSDFHEDVGLLQHAHCAPAGLPRSCGHITLWKG
jgi:hypothetical protein